MRAQGLSASAGLAATELYSAHRRKAMKLPDMQKKKKQKKKE